MQFPPTHEARQLQALGRADALADSAERAVRAVWLKLLALLREGRSAHDLYHAAAALFARLTPAVADQVGEDLADLARWSHAAAARLARRQWEESRPLREAAGDPADLFHFAPLDLFGFGAGPPPLDADGNPTQPPLIQLDPLTLSRIVFEPVNGLTWLDRLTNATKFAPAELLAGHVLQGVLAGETPREIAKRLLPVVQGVQVTARRIARTEAMRVAHSAQAEAWEELGDLVSGYQVHATLDRNTRPAHRARDGTVYHKVPGPGQKGLDQMPRPPVEADGTLAWNCRCYIVPVFA